MRKTRTNLLNMKIQRVVTFACIGFLACTSITFAESYVESGSLNPLFIVYETDPSQLTKSADNFLMQQITDRNLHNDVGAATALVGLGQKWNGWGSKAKHVSSKLAEVHPERLVAILDSRDVLFNSLNKDSIKKFVKEYANIVKDNEQAIVIGAESQCCVSAMTHAKPGSFLNDDMTRTDIEACNSGDIDCVHRGTEHQKPWEHAMQKMAKENGATSENIYVNAGIIVGKAKNIIAVYEILNMKETEDDQALFTELMLKRPDLIMLDYDQKLIGNSIWTKGMDGCIFDWNDDQNAFVHRKTQTSPVLLHFQGKFYECYENVAKQFGYHGNMRRKLAASPNNYNYNYNSASPQNMPGAVLSLIAALLYSLI